MLLLSKEKKLKKFMILKSQFAKVVRGLLPEHFRISADGLLALQTAAEDEAHRVLSCLATLAESSGRQEPLARDFMAMKKILQLAPSSETVKEARPEKEVKVRCGPKKTKVKTEQTVLKAEIKSETKVKRELVSGPGSHVTKLQPETFLLRQRRKGRQQVKCEL